MERITSATEWFSFLLSPCYLYRSTGALQRSYKKLHDQWPVDNTIKSFLIFTRKSIRPLGRMRLKDGSDIFLSVWIYYVFVCLKIKKLLMWCKPGRVSIQKNPAICGNVSQKHRNHHLFTWCLSFELWSCIGAHMWTEVVASREWGDQYSPVPHHDLGW